MENVNVPSSLIGALVFFLLLAIVAFVVVRETVRVIIKPALIIAGVALLAVWAGWLDETVVGAGFEWIGDRLLAGIHGVSEWVAESWQAKSGGG